MKKKFSEYNIPTADWILLEDERNIQLSLQNKIGFPAIVKPCDCNSSKGVLKVENDTELEIAIRQAFTLSRSKKVIIEEYNNGDEVSIDVWVDSEGAKVLSVSGTSKIKENIDNFTIYQSKYPISISEKLKKKIQETADKICNAFELENCPVLIQAIINNEEISDCALHSGVHVWNRGVQGPVRF